MIGNREKLAIQFIHGRLVAEVIGGTAPRRWECPEIIMEDDVLYNVLESLPGELKFKGEDVSLVIVAPSIEYLIIKAPPMKSKDLNLFLKRKAVAAKGENHIWGYTSLRVMNKEDNIYLHLVPEIYRSVFFKFCQNHNFQPTYLMTLGAIAPTLLTSEKNDELEMVAAAAGESTFLVVGKKNEPYLMREVPYTWATEDQATLDRLTREIQRTALFTKQQYNKQVTSIRVIGKQSDNAKDAGNTLTGTVVTFSDDDVQWLRIPSSLSPNRTDNLIPHEIIGHNSRRRLTIVFFAVVILLLMLSTGVEVTFQVINHLNSNTIRQSGVSESISELLNEKMEYDNRRSEIEINRGLFSAIGQQCHEPIPGWFAGYASDVLPDSLYLTRLYVVRDSLLPHFSVQIEGFGPRNPIHSATLLSRYQDLLVQYPVNLRIETHWRLQWAENLKSGGTFDDEKKGKVFRISGILQ